MKILIAIAFSLPLVGCYYGPSRSILLPENMERKWRVSSDIETPKIVYSMDSTQLKTLQIATVKVRRRISKSGAIELSSNGIQYEHGLYEGKRIQAGYLTKFGGGQEGDYFGVLSEHNRLFMLTNLVQGNYRIPFLEFLWIGFGLEFDIRSYTHNIENSNDPDTASLKLKSVNVIERDFYFTENIILKANKFMAFASVYSAPFIQFPTFETEYYRDNYYDTDLRRSGIALRKKRDYTFRIGMALEY